MHSNMNFLAPVAVLGFLAGMGGLAVSILALLVLAVMRNTKWVRRIVAVVGIGAIVYFGLLFGFSEGSREATLAPGQEKYFCEIDCHLSYSVRAGREEVQSGLRQVHVTLRTRFDETTISAQRPKDFPLTPNPREVLLIDGQDRTFTPDAATGIPLTRALIPGESYETELTFRLPADAKQLRLLITSPGWEEHLLIGDENSFGHKKTYLAIAAGAVLNSDSAKARD
jgi:hypothetical protein